MSERSFSCRVAAALLAVAVVAIPVATVRAQEFRVENRVYIADDTAPASSSVTLFADDAVYDFLADTDETTIFDAAAGRMVLMAPGGKVRTEWQTQQLADYCAEFKKWAAAQKDPMLRFLANPQFKETRGRAGKTVRLSSPMLVYEVTTQRPDDAAAVQRYAEFSDWFARLNAVTSGGGTPPSARIELNHLLADVGVLPREVEKRLKPKRGQSVRLRSTHEITWSLSAADRRRIDAARQQLASLTAVAYSEYQRRTAQLEDSKKRR